MASNREQARLPGNDSRVRQSHGFWDMDRVVEQLGVLSETAVTFSRCGSVHEIYERALDAVLALTGSRRASLLLFDPDGVLRFKGSRGISEAYRRAVEGHTPWTPGQREPEPIQVPDVALDSSLGKYREAILGEGILALSFFPLATASGTIGKLMVYWDQPHDATPAELALLRTVSGLTAYALERQHAVDLLEIERGLFVGGPSVVFKWQNRPHWPVEYVSPNVEEVFGYTPAYMRREETRFFSLIHPDDLDRVTEELRAFTEAGRPWFEQEYRLRRADGSWRWIYCFTVPIRAASHEVTHYHGYVLDQTERRAAFDEVRQSQRIESLGLMAGGVAHDFNNLLMGVLGNAALARDLLPEDSAAAGYLGDVTTAARHASELTKQLLAYSGKGSSTIKSVELASLVEECLRLLASVLSPRAAVSVNIAPRLAVRADATQLRQIVINLLTNASDALADAAGAIRVEARELTIGATSPALAPIGQSLAPGRYVVLTVADEGVGMDEATIAHIFDPFFTTKGQGRGLGLSAILGIVRSHLGAVDVDSRPGAGARFAIYLPAATLADEPAEPARGHLTETPSRAHILVVDDNEMVRSVVTRTLEFEHHTVEQADSAERALEILSERPTAWDAVIMDLTMPKMSGLEALAILRKRWPVLPVVIISGFSRSGVPARQRDPPPHFLEKPFSSDKLLEVLSAAMGGAASITRR